jgi:hypothetical protein
MGCITGDLDGQETPGQVTMSVIEIFQQLAARTIVENDKSHQWVTTSSDKTFTTESGTRNMSIALGP